MARKSVKKRQRGSGEGEFYIEDIITSILMDIADKNLPVSIVLAESVLDELCTMTYADRQSLI